MLIPCSYTSVDDNVGMVTGSISIVTSVALAIGVISGPTSTTDAVTDGASLVLGIIVDGEVLPSEGLVGEEERVEGMVIVTIADDVVTDGDVVVFVASVDDGVVCCVGIVGVTLGISTQPSGVVIGTHSSASKTSKSQYGSQIETL